ncbi:MAG: VacJ family lipoprotein [Cupriavidus sp.]|nr:MAG: VacJ family lipoprotein [Cupriavidus sp.]
MLTATLALGACAHSPVDDPSDPLEPVNRKIYSFNMTLDRYVAKPVAKGYTYSVPEEIRIGISNFYHNLTYPTVIVNDALQGKFKQSGLDTTRFLMNLTFGLGGLLDPASMVGLEKHDEDFGQTFGYWGVGPGWYLMLPFFGPSDNRDLVGRVVGIATDPTTYIADTNTTLVVTGVSVVKTRADLLSVDSVLEQQFDPYLFVRSAFLQRRQSQVYDGNPPREDYGLDDVDDDTPAEKPAKNHQPYAPDIAPVPRIEMDIHR